MYVDADILFALIKPNDRHAEFAERILGSKEKIYTSSVTLLELEIVSKREISDFVSKNILEIVLEKKSDIKIIPFDRKTLEKSLEFRKKFGLGVFDSAHAATAFLNDKKIVSTDHIFDEVKGIERVKPN